MLPLAIAGAQVAAPILSGLIGNALSSGDQDQSLAGRQAALQALMGVNVPSIEEQKIALAKLQQVGQYTPEALATYNQGDTGLSQISLDPRLMGAQMGALSQLQQLGQTGLSAADRVALGEARRQTEGDVQAQNAAIQQNLAARGVAGGGTELAARLAASQGGANRMSQESDRLAAMAQQKSLQAIANAGELGGQIGQQQFGQQAQVQNAQDVINRFNTQNRQQVAGTNVGERNVAQRANLGESQRIADTNAGLTNQQEIHNKGLYQQQFNDAMQKAYGVAGQQGQMSDYYGGQAAATRGEAAGIGSALSKGASAYGTSLENDKNRRALLQSAGKLKMNPGEY